MTFLMRPLLYFSQPISKGKTHGKIACMSRIDSSS